MPATDPLLDVWQKGINEHRPDDVAAVFADDAVFQGLRPFAVGRPGVADYYASQPVGMTVDYRILAARPLGPDARLAWVEADFDFARTGTGRDPVLVNLTVVAERTGEGWRIAHYHVSPRL